MLSEDINWIARTLKHHLQEDGQIRILEKEAQGFIANLNTCARRVKVLERRPIATDAPRDTAVHADTGRKQWREENKVLWAHLRDPDAARGRYAASAGRADGGVRSLNALWEVDATTDDVLLSDGQRHTIRGIIDVRSRRVLLHVARISPLSAVCTAPRDPCVGSTQCRTMRQRQGVHLPAHTHRSHGPRGSRRKPLRPFSRSANPSSSVRWARSPTSCLSFCPAFAATM